jgi:hypothetical protein
MLVLFDAFDELTDKISIAVAIAIFSDDINLSF